MILFYSIPNLFAQNRTNVILHPLCFENMGFCNKASTILKLPAMGNFWVNSMCRTKTPGERANNICLGMNIVLGIEAFINLQPSFYQWRNQCYPNLQMCNQGLIIWKQLIHPLGVFNFNAQCAPFDRSFWKMTNPAMDANGIFNCTPFDPIELKIQAFRVK